MLPDLLNFQVNVVKDPLQPDIRKLDALVLLLGAWGVIAVHQKMALLLSEHGLPSLVLLQFLLVFPAHGCLALFHFRGRLG